MKILKYWKPVLIALIILYGSLTSSSNFKQLPLLDFKHLDKVLHFFLYAVLSISFYASLNRNTIMKRIDRISIVIAVVVSYGLIMEVFQYAFTTDRSAEIFDAISNSLGCMFGIMIYPLAKRLSLDKYL